MLRTISPPDHPSAEQLLRGDVSESPIRFADPADCDDCDVVIFDGQCVFCKTGVRQLRRFDGGGKRLSYISLHDPRVKEFFPDLTHEQLMNEMFIVQPDGTSHGGADAVRYLSRRLPALWWSMPILHLPGTANLWRWIYAKVAASRYRLMGKDCDSGSCQIGKR